MLITILDYHDAPIEGAVILLDQATATNTPYHTGKDGKVDIPITDYGIHTFEFHIEGEFPGVKLKQFIHSLTLEMTLNLFWRQ